MILMETTDLIIRSPDEYYYWKCEYVNGQVINQWDEYGNEIPFKNLDLKKIKYFALIVKDRNKTPYLHDHIVNLDRNKKLIYWRRIIGTLGSGTENFNLMFIIYKLGYEEKINGKVVKTIMHIYPNGTIELSGNSDPSLIDDYLKALRNGVR